MKRKDKILFSIVTTLLIFLMGVAFTSNAAYVSEQSFTNESGIENDLYNCKLDISDYKAMNSSSYNRFDVILITEAVADDNSSINYIYVYNPYQNPSNYQVTLFTYNINNKNINTTGLLVDKTDTIAKYKVDTNITYYDNITETRKYNISSLMINNIETCIDFTCTINQKNKTISQEFDGYIFITEKDFVDIIPCDSLYYIGSSYKDTSYASKSSDEFYQQQSPSQSLGIRGTMMISQFFFLNFDSNKDIDKINEIDVKYKVYSGRVRDYINGVGSTDELHKNYPESYNNLVQDYSKGRTISKEQTKINYEYANSSLIDYTYTNKESYNLKTFYTTKNDGSRYDTFPDLFNHYSSTTKLSSGKTLKESFNRQCSLLVDALPMRVDYNTVLAGYNFYYNKYKMTDLEVVRINFTTDGVTYNLKANSGELIDSETPAPIDPSDSNNTTNDNKEESLWDLLLKALKNLLFNHTSKFFMLIAIAVVIIICISQVGINMIAKGIVWIFKILFSILLFPFKLLIALFKR